MTEGGGTAKGPGAGRILVVDDDQELCELLVTYLERESFSVECAHDGATGLERAIAEPFDVLILDLMLPSLPGFEVLRRLRRTRGTPVLVLSARGEDVDRIVGLELGADDYLAKPFNPRELVARIHAILRRTQTTTSASVPRALGEPSIVAGGLEVDRGRREARYAGTPVPLTTSEFDVLLVLVRSPDKIVTREHISKQGLGRPLNPYDRTVDTHVMNLRRKLQALAGEHIVIKTVRNAGYMLVVSGTGARRGPERPPQRRK